MKIKIGIATLVLLGGIFNLQTAYAVDSEALKDILGNSKRIKVVKGNNQTVARSRVKTTTYARRK